MLIQSRPMILKLPARLEAGSYVHFSLELAGLPSQQARALRDAAQGRPMLFLPLETSSQLRQVRVRGESATLILYPPSQTGQVASVLDWQQDGFDFRILGRDPATAVALTESLW